MIAALLAAAGASALAGVPESTTATTLYTPITGITSSRRPSWRASAAAPSRTRSTGTGGRELRERAGRRRRRAPVSRAATADERLRLLRRRRLREPAGVRRRKPDFNVSVFAYSQGAYTPRAARQSRMSAHAGRRPASRARRPSRPSRTTRRPGPRLHRRPSRPATPRASRSAAQLRATVGPDDGRRRRRRRVTARSTAASDATSTPADGSSEAAAPDGAVPSPDAGVDGAAGDAGPRSRGDGATDG